MNKDRRILVVMLVALACSMVTMVAATSLLRDTLGHYPELALSVLAAVAAYTLVTRAFLEPPR